MQRKRLALHWQITIGLVAGAALGGLAAAALGPDGAATAAAWLRPVGTVFVRLITMVAAPLVLTSLIVGASSIADPRRLGRIGGRTLALYLFTTALAVSLGLGLAGLFRPGAGVSPETQARLLDGYRAAAATRVERAESLSFVDQITGLVPTNPFAALAEGNMLQIVFFALVAGIALAMIPRERAEPVVRFFEGFTDVLIRIVDGVMRLAPAGVFALVFAITAEFGFGIVRTLGGYALVVALGLALHVVLVYAPIVRFGARGRMPLTRFFRALAPVQLLAFSSSSSAATLPLTMETARERLGVSDRVTSFVLPLGATINMDGTALYQGVAAAFIAQVYGLPLTLAAQVGMVATATLASIGTAAVPGAGLVMLVIVLKAAGIPAEGVALIVGVDRILDMCRTVVNVTGDAAVAVVVAAAEGELTAPVAAPVRIAA